MASPLELSLDFKPHSYSMLLKSFGGQSEQTQKLEDFLSRLEEERLKIDAFKRELPLCMQLLSNALEAHRQQLRAYRSANQGPRPVLEEFIPLKQSTSESSEKSSNNSDKANWMTSAQLWSQASDGTKPQSTILFHNEPEIGLDTCPKLALDNKQRNGGAFHPFSKERNSFPSPNLRALPDLALASAERQLEDKKCLETENGISSPRREDTGKGGSGGVGVEQAKRPGNSSDGQTTATTTAPNTNQTHRKARRCWSPDLHRRFVNALQMLGGSQVATPKQIRELMKVDGLTNDEVKSHLQKYRLHTRRPSPNPQTAGAQAPQLVVLGGIWMPPEYATAAAAAAHTGASALYGAHPASHAQPHYCGPGLPQEFYAAPPPPPHGHQLHHHSVHHQLHVYNATCQTHSSPKSDARGQELYRSESIEDGKSDSSSWKGTESGENGGAGKGLGALRRDHDGEESNGSGITLKF
ncbi:LOW QUALITY PROTEIN: myb family transcription factor EFM-like [Juglans microcarpa x Juglans regia]|uniref:LOW QUALITY PROTEIN: myb family transcription factor EFM-like n=1 Tax=Juglans microcarpa x Juglans regia TaxID=2249226 RepID=UPI001B7DE0C1|nr:LOW QUALITY PROTEIN: myb family transcription factor EFM-like [Juglans microcarpa x Juglans regia]